MVIAAEAIVTVPSEPQTVTTVDVKKQKWEVVDKTGGKKIKCSNHDSSRFGSNSSSGKDNRRR